MEQRLIDANELRKKALWMERLDNNGIPFDVRAVSVSSIDLAPTIEAEPVRHGRWIVEEREFSVMGKDGFIRQERKTTFTCSNPKCGVGIVGLENMNYCPSCGAKMDLEE